MELTIDVSRLMDPAQAPEYVAELCSSDIEELEVALLQHAPLYGWASSLWYAATWQEAKSKARVARAEAQAYKAMLEEDPKIPISKAKALLPDDKVVVAAIEAWLKDKLEATAIRALLLGLEHRRDMLVQLSSRQKRDQYFTND